MINKMFKHGNLMRVVMLLVMLPIAAMAWAQEPTIYAGFIADDASGGYGNEGYDRFVDGKFTSDNWTKWGTDSKSTPQDEKGSYYWIDFHANEAIGVAKYILTTGNDNTEWGNRNPKSWVLKGKFNNNDEWTTIATVKGDNTMQDENFENYEFSLDAPGTYKYFRFMISETHGADFMQLCELRFKAPEDPKSLAVATVKGIESRYTFSENGITISPIVTAYGETTALTEGVDYISELKNEKDEVISKKDGVYKLTGKGKFTLTIKATDGSSYKGEKKIVFYVADYYSIILPTNIEHGSVTSSVSKEVEGEKVFVTVSWEKGYEFDERNFSITCGDNQNVTYNSDYRHNSVIYDFIMPAADVTVNAIIRKQTYEVYVRDFGEGCKITPSVERASKGQTVTLIIQKADNIVLDELKAFYSLHSDDEKNVAAKKLNDYGRKNRHELTLTKVDDTHYTFVMPDTYVEICAKIHRIGKYAINIAKELSDGGVLAKVNDIPAESADAGEEIWLEFNTEKVEDLSVIGADNTVVSITERGGRYYSFAMPEQPVTINASTKYRIFSGEYNMQDCSVNISVDGDDNIGENDYIAPGTKVTLKLISNNKDNILSYLRVINNTYYEDQELIKVPLTKVKDSTYTFIMPPYDVSVEGRFGRPVKVSFAANGGTGKMDDITIGNGFFIECGFTAPEGCEFAGWKERYIQYKGIDERVYADGDSLMLQAMWKTNVSYVDANGSTADVDAYVLTGSEVYNQLNSGWYVVRNSNTDADRNNGIDVAYKGSFICDYSTTNLILCDNAEMTIDGHFYVSDADFTIYGQSEGSGKFTINDDDVAINVDHGKLIVNGGIINANTHNGYTIYADNGLEFNGGKLMACCKNTNAIRANVTLNSHNASDRFKAQTLNSAESCISGSVFIVKNVTFIADDEKTYMGQLSDEQKYAINGMTLAPFKAIALDDDADNTKALCNWKGGVANITLKGHKLYKDGEWNTLCLPFDVKDFKGTPLEGATVKEFLTTSNLDANGVLTLNFKEVAAMKAGKPYIVKWDVKSAKSLRLRGGNAEINDPTFVDVTITNTQPIAVVSEDGSVTFVGHYSPFKVGDTFKGDDGNLYEILTLEDADIPSYLKSSRTLSSFSDYFYVPTSNNTPKVTTFVFDGTTKTGITSVQSDNVQADSWYTLDGRKLNKKPTVEGVYIHGGSKVVIKNQH
ncbi:MAG: hypothetical protein E7104_10405 [Prevotella sp.]|nr:hypothetical protein [Prevotella sp.]